MKSNKIQHTKKALLEGLEKSLGVVTTACKQVGIDRTTFYRYYKEDKEFARQVDDLSNVAKDFAESQLFKQIQDGNPTATIFYLKRQELNVNGSVESKLIEWKPAEKKK
jgi:hypothetical protein